MIVIKKLSYSEVKKFIEDLGFILISKEYLGNSSPLILADKEGYYYKSTYANFRKGSKPFRFIKSNPYCIDNIILWCKIHSKSFELISREYKNNSTPLKWKCLKEGCNSIFICTWSAISQGQGCGVCHGKQVSISNCLANKNPELAKEWHSTKNGDLTPHNITSGSEKRVWWKCSKNPNHEWEATVYNRSNGYNCPYCAGQLPSKDYNLLFCHPDICEEWDYNKNNKRPEEYTPKSGKLVWWICSVCGESWKARIAGRTCENKGCSICNLSKGEKVIKEYLTSNNIDNIEQKKFPNLLGLNNRQLSYDFYLPQYNLLIEYQGEQHYRPIDFKGLGETDAQKQFFRQQEHDRRKRIYAQKHKIKLIEIPYWNFDNIESILSNKIIS